MSDFSNVKLSPMKDNRTFHTCSHLCFPTPCREDDETNTQPKHFPHHPRVTINTNMAFFHPDPCFLLRYSVEALSISHPLPLTHTKSHPATETGITHPYFPYIYWRGVVRCCSLCRSFRCCFARFVEFHALLESLLLLVKRK